MTPLSRIPWEALNLPLSSRIIFYGCLAVNVVIWPLLLADKLGWF
jgi:hypothetical protein